MFTRIRHTLKYIFLTSVLCTCMIACGNTDRRSVGEQSGTETLETENPDTEREEEADIADAETENEAASTADVVENIEDMPEIERMIGGIIDVKIKNEGEYKGFVSRLEEFTDCHYLWMDLEETDTTVYLDEILAYNNFDDVTIKNGGIISARNMENLNPMTALSLRYVFSIDKDMLSHITSSDIYNQTEIRINLDNRYTGKLPIEELLNDRNGTNVKLIWDDDTEGAGLLDVQENMENLREWDYLQSVQETEGGCLKAIYKLSDGDYSYTSYEFYDHYEEDEPKIRAAFICMKDRESNGAEYFDILDIPDKFLDHYSMDRDTYRRLDIGDDLNNDGYRDLVFQGKFDSAPITFLWNEEEQRFILDESVADFFERANAERDINADIKDENYIDTSQVILDFLNMDAIEFQENYDRDDLYQSGILYCGHEAWKYDGNQVDAFQEPGDYYDVMNITAIRFYKRQPVPVCLDMNINDQFGQYEEEISIDYHTDYAVSIYTVPGDNNLPYIQEISFVKIELYKGTAPEDLYQYIERQYYRVMESLKDERWVVSPDGEKAACVSNGALPKHPAQIYIWYQDDQPYTVFRETWELRIVGWIDHDHLVCYYNDGFPMLVHLEKNEIEVIPREKCDFDSYGAKYYIQGKDLIARPYSEEPYRWKILERDGEIYVAEPE